MEKHTASDRKLEVENEANTSDLRAQKATYDHSDLRIVQGIYLLGISSYI